MSQGRIWRVERRGWGGETGGPETASPKERENPMPGSSSCLCSRCNSDRVVSGVLHAATYLKFQVNELAPAWLTTERTTLKTESALCMDCGLVWLSTDTKEAARKLGKYGTDELKSRLGLDEEAES